MLPPYDNFFELNRGCFGENIVSDEGMLLFLEVVRFLVLADSRLCLVTLFFLVGCALPSIPFSVFDKNGDWTLNPALSPNN